MATIDVLLPVKNRFDFLAESLDSICNQRFKDWRLLVLDHGSTDGSLDLAYQYQERDARIEVHSLPDIVGLAALRNRGLELCDCRYVMLHDSDDVAFPDRMEVVLAAFRDQSDCIVIGGQAVTINRAGKDTGHVMVPVGKNRVSAAIFFRNPITQPAAMMDFAAMQKLGARYGGDFLKVLPSAQSIEVNNLAEDYFMFGQLAVMQQCTNIPASLIKYRWHGGNVSVTRFQEQMKVSLEVSRFLVRSFCVMHDLPYFDPAPFCNLGGLLFDVAGQTDFAAEFEIMANTLRRGLGASAELERELAYRKVIATRNEVALLWRYYQFRSRHTPETGEWNAVRSWLIRRVRETNKILVISNRDAQNGNA
ncbi:MAG: glycosyltransferase family 2 protein [Sulfuriferula sp.]